jgi:hypothetical protein
LVELKGRLIDNEGENYTKRRFLPYLVCPAHTHLRMPFPDDSCPPRYPRLPPLVTGHDVIEVIARGVDNEHEIRAGFDVDDRGAVTREGTSNCTGAVGNLKPVDTSDDRERLRVTAGGQDN